MSDIARHVASTVGGWASSDSLLPTAVGVLAGIVVVVVAALVYIQHEER